MRVSKEKIMIRLTALGMSMDKLVKKSCISKWRLCTILNTGECDKEELNSISRALVTRSETISDKP